MIAVLKEHGRCFAFLTMDRNNNMVPIQPVYLPLDVCIRFCSMYEGKCTWITSLTVGTWIFQEGIYEVVEISSEQCDIGESSHLNHFCVAYDYNDDNENYVPVVDGETSADDVTASHSVAENRIPLNDVTNEEEIAASRLRRKKGMISFHFHHFSMTFFNGDYSYTLRRSGYVEAKCSTLETNERGRVYHTQRCGSTRKKSEDYFRLLLQVQLLRNVSSKSAGRVISRLL